MIHGFIRPSKASALRAAGIEPIPVKSHLSLFWAISEGGIVLKKLSKTRGLIFWFPDFLLKNTTPLSEGGGAPKS